MTLLSATPYYCSHLRTLGYSPTLLENLSSKLSLTLSNGVPVIILGDFNLHSDYFNILASHFLDLFSNDLLSQPQLLILIKWASHSPPTLELVLVSNSYPSIILSIPF